MRHLKFGKITQRSYVYSNFVSQSMSGSTTVLGLLGVESKYIFSGLSLRGEYKLTVLVCPFKRAFSLLVNSLRSSLVKFFNSSLLSL